jgi:hypothetical protein
MYYSESVIDGVLHYKLSPESEWDAFSLPSMTNKYIASQIVINELTKQVEQLIADSADYCIDTGLPTKTGVMKCDNPYEDEES